MRKPAHGTIFAVPLPDGTYIFGRVMLDVMAMLKRRLFPNDSPVAFYSDAYLIQMYSLVAAKPEYAPSPVLIPGVYVRSNEVGEKWPVVGSESVDPRTVEFPETLIGWDHAKGEVAFRYGEISCPIPLTENDFLKVIGVFGGSKPPVYWPYLCLWALGRRSEIPREWPGITLATSDLRFSPHRARVYEHLPFPMEMSYFDKQKQLGLHLERFYE